MRLIDVGGVMQAIGAALLVSGLRKNYLFQASKDHSYMRLAKVASRVRQTL